jgi:hypothetical protein
LKCEASLGNQKSIRFPKSAVNRWHCPKQESSLTLSS